MSCQHAKRRLWARTGDPGGRSDTSRGTRRPPRARTSFSSAAKARRPTLAATTPRKHPSGDASGAESLLLAPRARCAAGCSPGCRAAARFIECGEAVVVDVVRWRDSPAVSLRRSPPSVRACGRWLGGVASASTKGLARRFSCRRQGARAAASRAWRASRVSRRAPRCCSRWLRRFASFRNACSALAVVA
jgi:hypothetical protein